MTIICPVCHRFAHTRLQRAVRLLGSDGTERDLEFRSCLRCDGMAVVRAQSARGTVCRRAGGTEEVVDVGGEVVAVERRAPKNWDERWAAVA